MRAGLPHEAFMVIFLNTKNKVLDYKVMQEGTEDPDFLCPPILKMHFFKFWVEEQNPSSQTVS